MSEIEEKSEEQVLQEKKVEFLNRYGELTKEFKLDLATYPMFVPDGQGGFKIMVQSTVVDISNQPVKSNFVADEPAK